MTKEGWKRRAEHFVRIGSLASVAFAPCSSVEPQKDIRKLNETSRRVLSTESPLGSRQLSFKHEGTEVIFESREREQQAETPPVVLGLFTGFNESGSIIITSSAGGKKEIKLPEVQGFAVGGMSLSPDATRVAAWREQDGASRFEVFITSVHGEDVHELAPNFLRRFNAYDRFGTFLKWSPDGKKLAVISGQHGGGKTAVFDLDSEQVLFERQGSLENSFSPDGNWFAKIGRRSIEVIGIDGQSMIINDGAGAFSWSPDSKLIAFHRCSFFSETNWGDICLESSLATFNLETGQIRKFDDSMSSVRPEFSSSGDKVAFRPYVANARVSGISVVDIKTGESRYVIFPPEISIGESWFFRFADFEGDKLLLYGRKPNDPRLHLLWLDMRTESVVLTNQVPIEGFGSPGIRELSDSRLILELENRAGERSFKVVEVTGRDGELPVTHLGDSPSSNWMADGTESFGFVREGDLVLSGEDKDLLFINGLARKIKHKESRQFFENQRRFLPEGLLPVLPEGEEIEFLPGDVIGHIEGGMWYLRNGKKYQIQNWDWFKNNTRFERNLIGVEKEILERITTGQLQEPILGRDTLLDWDGRLKEFQPFGGRMIIFTGGYDSSSMSQRIGFEQIKEKLIEQGWKETQFLEATYNVNIDVSKREINPNFYLPEYTKIYPPQNFSKMRLQLQRYKEMLPLTKFILIGHSLGGLMAFEAAGAHTDAIETVITLDSPLKGVDRAALNEYFGPDIDEIIRIIGEEVGRYLVPMAEDPAAREAQEDKVVFLKSRRVRVFTFSNDDDWLVRNRVSVLRNSDFEFDGQGVELIRHLGHFSPRGPGDFLSGHGQILQEGSFLEELSRILPAS